MMSKIYSRIVVVYAVLAAISAIFLCGAAIRAHENALSPFAMLALKSQSDIIAEESE